jgi:putative ABC transport system substrate-binding protein
MRRREFIALLGGVAVVWPHLVRAQQSAKLPAIGILAPGTTSSHGPWFAALVERLRELGWNEGRNVAIEYRWAEGRTERLVEMAAELVRLKVNVIVTTAPAVPAAKRATSTTPIVFALSGNPVVSGFVSSLARPGGNVTGMSMQHPDTAGKRLELLREIVPGFRRLAIIGNVTDSSAALEMSGAQKAVSALGLELAATLELRQAEDIGPAFESIKGRADALYVASDPLVNTNRIRINTLALVARLPTIHGFRELVEAGGLMSYGPNILDLFRRAAGYVDKILRGAKPGDLPVEQPIKFDLIINLTTAKALDLAIPESFLLRADEVIE